MKRALWTQKLSDEALKDYIKKTEFLEETGNTKDEEILVLSNTWYDHPVHAKRLILLSIDLWKEAAFRWAVNGQK